MAVFGKPDAGAALLRRIQQRLYRDRAELRDLLEQVRRHAMPLDELLWMLTHQEQQVREFATEQLLGGKAEASVVDALLRESIGQPEHVKRDLVALALRVDAGWVASRVGPLAASKRSEHRELALHLLSVLPTWRDHLRVLKSALNDPSAELRRRAACLLARDPQHPPIFLVLRDLLFAEDPALRSEALRALAETRRPDIVEPFLERLPLVPDRDRAIIIRALSAMASDPRARLEERVLPALADEREEVRSAAMQLLGQIPDRVRFVRAFLRESPKLAYWLRERCLESLLQVGDQLVEPLLVLMRDEAEEVRVGAITLAARVRDPRFAPAMQTVFLGEADWWVRALAADALAEFPEPAVIECLASGLGDPDVRYGALGALGKTKSPHALPYLFQALQAPERGIRRCALEGLRGHQEPAVVDAVHWSAACDPDESVRDKALSVLPSLGPIGEQIAAQLGLQQQAQAAAGAGSAVPAGLEMVNPALNPGPA